MSSEPAKVLVVEDEMVLRMRAVDIVNDAGFTAVEAVNADDAFAILESRGDISLLFSDIQMPGTMDGLTLAHAVHARWPSIGIILVSGKIKLADITTPEDSRFFGKPVQAQQMVAELQDMIGAGALKFLPQEALPLAVEAFSNFKMSDTDVRSAMQKSLAAENDSLRLLLEQAGIDAKTLVAQAGIDAAEREASDKLQRLILEELHHRIKNILATVGAIASQSLRGASSATYAQHAIEGRLMALGRAHDLLMQTSWASASLLQTVQAAIESYDVQNAARFKVEGEDISITSGAVVALAMTLNELCTNATKFGALSTPTGEIEIAWSRDPSNTRVRLTWSEIGGPEVREPTRKSFGSRMIGSLGQQLRGDVELIYEKSGFKYSLDVPVASLTDKPTTSQGQQSK